jgi:hypothetical protein
MARRPIAVDVAKLPKVGPLRPYDIKVCFRRETGTTGKLLRKVLASTPVLAIDLALRDLSLLPEGATLTAVKL